MEESEAIKSVSALVPFLIITFIIVIGVILLNHRFRKNLYQQQLEQERERLEYQQRMLQTSLQVQEDERERIAKDLHDELGAMLSISKRWLIQLEELNTEHTQKISEIRELSEVMLTSTRRISHDLMPLYLENTELEEAIIALAKRTEKAGDVKVILALPEHPKPLDSLMKLSLYRIFSELINNSLKYAQANELHIKMYHYEGHLHFHYTDNGKGFDPNKNIEGLGLRSIESRVLSMNGTLKYGNRVAESGFFATLKLPYL